ncbi:MAG: hypothetical protein AAF489_10280 [Bacteroidota bacterium]
MLRNIIVTLGILCVGFCVDAQSSYFTTEESAPFNDVSKEAIINTMFETEDGGLICVRSAKKKILVSEFATDYRLTNNIELPLEGKEYFLGASYDESSLKIFTQHRESNIKKGINCYSYDPDKNTFERTDLFTVEVYQRLGKKRALRKGTFDIDLALNMRRSPNGKYTSFLVENLGGKKNTYGIWVYNEALKLEYHTAHELEENRRFYFDDFVITNNGVAFSSGKLIFKEKIATSTKGNDFDYIINKVDRDQVDSKILNLEENKIKELKFSQSVSGLKLFGFYSELSSKKIKGGLTYYFKDTDISNVELKHYPFPKILFDDFYGESKARRKSKKEAEFDNFYLDYTVEDELGNSYLLAEEFYINDGYNRAEKIYGDIIVLKFNETGVLEWGRGIQKLSTIPSYQVFLMDDKLMVMLSASKKSGERKKVTNSFFGKPVLVNVILDTETGDQEFETFPSQDSKSIYLPYLGIFKKGHFVVPNRSKNKKQFFILSKK